MLWFDLLNMPVYTCMSFASSMRLRSNPCIQKEDLLQKLNKKVPSKSTSLCTFCYGMFTTETLEAACAYTDIIGPTINNVGYIEMEVWCCSIILNKMINLCFS